MYCGVRLHFVACRQVHSVGRCLPSKSSNPLSLFSEECQSSSPASIMLSMAMPLRQSHSRSEACPIVGLLITHWLILGCCLQLGNLQWWVQELKARQLQETDIKLSVMFSCVPCSYIVEVLRNRIHCSTS